MCIRDSFQAVPGGGLTGELDGSRLTGGNLKYISQTAEVTDAVRRQAEELAEEGKTPLFFACLLYTSREGFFV